MIEDPWFVHKVTPQLEFVAANALRKDGFTVFVPSVRIRRRKGKRDKFKAFFPGYMFVSFWVLRREQYEHIEDRNANG